VADLAAKAKRLYEHFLAPLVLGGELTPGPAIGARDALGLAGGEAAVDADVRSQVDVARVRVARRLVPVDTVDGPSGGEWALAAALHDLVHALHPGFGGLLHAHTPDKLIDFTDAIVERVAPAPSLAEELSRFTYFARMFEIERTDTRVSWWTGSRTFLGEAPPPRLLAWPELRRVNTDETKRLLAELPGETSAARAARFWCSVEKLLEKVPLTDLATCARPAPRFRWTGANLGLFATPHTRVVALRALALQPSRWVDAALARATRTHVDGKAWDNVNRIADVLGERALALGASNARDASFGPEPDEALEDDAHYAQAFGAIVALGRIESLGTGEESKARITERLMPLARSAVGREIEARVMGNDNPR
jgi:hypothetical protein